MQLSQTLILIRYNSNLILNKNLKPILVFQIIDILVILFFCMNILNICKILAI